MTYPLETLLNHRQTALLSSVVQIGNETYNELMDTQKDKFAHQYFSDINGRIRTKLIQMQCEIESRSPDFPFHFYQRKFKFNQYIPELHTDKLIINIARTSKPHILPNSSKYKIELSNNNSILNRQLMFDEFNTNNCIDVPFYAILAFGGIKEPFSVLQFPEPGFSGIATSITIPQFFSVEGSEEIEVFERKKAVLKYEFNQHSSEEAIS